MPHPKIAMHYLVVPDLLQECSRKTENFSSDWLGIFQSVDVRYSQYSAALLAFAFLPAPAHERDGETMIQGVSARVAATLVSFMVFSGGFGCDLASDTNRDGRIVIGVIGDSNSTGAQNWPDILAQMAVKTRPKWQVVNYARSGATIIDQPKLPSYWWFQTQVSIMLAASPLPDVVILAGGTNDARGDVDSGLVIDKLFDLQDQITAGTAATHPDGSTHSALILTAQVPVIYPTVADAEPWDPGRTEEYTDAMRASFSPLNMLDFRTIVTQADYTPAGVHFTSSGQYKRAAAAYRKLTNGQNPPF